MPLPRLTPPLSLVALSPWALLLKPLLVAPSYFPFPLPILFLCAFSLFLF